MIINKLNERTLFVNTSDVKETIYNKNSVRNLSKITLKDGQVISLKDYIPFEEDGRSINYKVNYITDDRKGKILLRQFKLNKTSEYVQKPS